jgi:hypothetical protein
VIIGMNARSPTFQKDVSASTAMPIIAVGCDRSARRSACCEPAGWCDALVLDYGVRCRPIRVLHDGGATFGFRFDGAGDLFTKPWALAYVADLGSWNDEIVRALADVDLLALEFNHDRELEHASQRPKAIIDRVLGDEGHLSNEQAASLLREVIRLSKSHRLRQVVQLHLSGECNRPALAMDAVQRILGESNHFIQVHTAHPDRASPTIHVKHVDIPDDPEGAYPFQRSEYQPEA